MAFRPELAGERPVTDEMRRAIADCNTCHDACLSRALDHCLPMGGRHAGPDHVRRLLDCPAMSRTAAGFLLRGSPGHARVCELCAVICDQCARSCDTFGEDDLLRSLADTCRRCANSCRDLSRMQAAA